jgi:hypothetical protein
MLADDCEMNDELTDTDDVAPLSETNTNQNEGSSDSFPVTYTSHTTVSTLLGHTNHIDDSQSFIAASIDGVGDNEANFSVSFKVCPDIPFVKCTKKSPLWKFFAHFDTVYHPTMRYHPICLICHERGVDKLISVGKSASTGPLWGHL